MQLFSPELLIFLALFLLGTILLARTPAERHFIVFLVRTKRFLGLIDSAASFFPVAWRFIADFSIVLSFSGLGAFYLSKQGREGRNLDLIILLFGGLAALLWSDGLGVLALLFFAVLLVVFGLSRMRNPLADFLVMSSLISLVFLKALPWYMAVPEGVFGLLAIVAGSLVENALDITTGESTLPGVSPIIPWMEAGQLGFIIPGLGIFIPLIHGVLALVILLVVHEFSHGVLARVHDLDLKSTGLLTLGPIPIGAFVEPDEEEFKKARSIAKMRVLSMGSFANIVLAVSSILLFAFLVMPTGGWTVMSSSAPGLADGAVITAIGDVNLSEINHISAAMDASLFSNRFYLIRNDSFENQTEIGIATSDGLVSVKNEDLSGLKIKYIPEYRFGAFSGFFAVLSFWLYFFNLNVALVNLLPIVPFDGGKMVMELIDMLGLGEDLVRKIVYAILFAGLLTLLINAYPLIQILSAGLF